MCNVKENLFVNIKLLQLSFCCCFLSDLEPELKYFCGILEYSSVFHGVNTPDTRNDCVTTHHDTVEQILF